MDHREKAQRIPRIATACVVAGTTLAVLSPTAGSSAMVPQVASAVVAVAPFDHGVGMREENLAMWAAARLTDLLSRKGVPVVPFAQVQSALREAGRRPSDLVSLAATEDLAHRLGADAVVTGRLITAETEREAMGDLRESTVTFALRVMVIATRRISYTEVTGSQVGGLDGLTRAADRALQEYVSRLPPELF